MQRGFTGFVAGHFDRTSDFPFEKMRHEASQRIAESGFSCAIGTDDSHEFTFIHLQIDILQRRRIRERIFIGDVLEAYDSHSLAARAKTTSATRIQRRTLSEDVSGTSYKEVFGRVEANPRASMAIARSSTSTNEPKTSGPTSGTREPIRLRKL